MATQTQGSTAGLSDEELAQKLQSEEGFDALAVQAQRESDEEYARYGCWRPYNNLVM